MNRVVSNAMVVKRGEAAWCNIVYAAFFIAKGPVATALWAVLPVWKAAVGTNRPQAGGYSANARTLA